MSIYNSIAKAYGSPSYWYYQQLDIREIKSPIGSEERTFIKRETVELLKYFFYFIDFIFIFCILIKNTFTILREGSVGDKIIYLPLLIIVFITLCKFQCNIQKCVNSKDDNLDLLEKVIEVKGYKNNVHKLLLKFSLKYTVFLGLIMICIAFLQFNHNLLKLVVGGISVFYFITRPIHYFFVFYNDYKKKISESRKFEIGEKIRYIELALWNYIKIILEFSILIYILKYMGWAFLDSKFTTIFEVLYFVISSELEVVTGIEMFVDLLRIAMIWLVIALNLASYTSLELRNNSNSTGSLNVEE